MLRISLDALEVLDAIDRRGSFAAASKELHRVPSTVSYVIAKLEEELGVQLFERLGPRVALTQAGQELLKEGRYLLKAAQDLEHRVRRVASGWETEFAIGMDSMLSPRGLEDDIRTFCDIAKHTHLRLTLDTLSGTWESLLDGRVDLLLGAAGEGPSGGGYISEPMGSVPFVFAVAPTHPLAGLSRPLTRADLQAHRAVAVADSARKLPVRTVGMLFGQEALTVPDMQTKLAYQMAGLGFGFLPEAYANEAIAKGLLVKCEVEEPRPPETFYLAWRSNEAGAALKWWLERLRGPGRLQKMLAASAG
jgi:DNA-binding transcriptional LysR family regulator